MINAGEMLMPEAFGEFKHKYCEVTLNNGVKYKGRIKVIIVNFQMYTMIFIDDIKGKCKFLTNIIREVNIIE